MKKNEPITFGNIERSQSLSDRVTDMLISAVNSGDLLPGQMLPSERKLCLQFGVSRTVVREAIRSLTAKGLARIDSGRGVEITTLDVSDMTKTISFYLKGRGELSYQMVHEVRSAIEIQIAGLAAERATPENIKTLYTICEELEKCAIAADINGASELDFKFHQELANASQNELLEAVFDSISDILKAVRRKRMGNKGVPELALAAHRAIYNEVASGNISGARLAMGNHLDEGMQMWLVTGLPEL